METIDNRSIATELMRIAHEVTESRSDSDTALRSLSLGIAVGALTRAAFRLRQPDAPQVGEYEVPELYDVARDCCHAFGVAWTDPRTGIRYEPPPR